MRSKRKSVTTNLLAIILVFAIALCLTLGVAYTAECSEAQISEGTGLVTTSEDIYEDFSSYTDKELPETIDKSNILNFVPISKFNKNGTTIYNGRNYGFVIYSDAGTNHVLLFKEIYTPHEDGDGYEITLKVVYENSFFKGLNNSVIYARSPYHIALADIKFDNIIIDADVNDSILCSNYDNNSSTGAYYTQVRYENQFSYYDGELAADTALAVISMTADIVSSFADIFGFETAGKIADGVSNICTLASNGLLIYDISQTDDFWVERSTFNTDIDFPLTRQGQIEKYGILKKDIRIDVQADKNEYLSADNGGGFARTIYRVMNENRKDYYINNRISFDICRYNGAQRHKVDDAYIESVYCASGTNCNKYGQIVEQDGEFKYESYQRFVPLVNTNLFNFIPDQIGNYNIIVPNGYYLVIDGKVQSSNKVSVNSEGCKVGIAKDSSTEIVDNLYSRLLPQDFYNGQVLFTNIFIQKDQELKINETTQVKDIFYTVERSSDICNDIYMLDVGNNNDLIDLYITDDNLNVLSTATKKDGRLYANYPMKANEAYGVVCVNRTGNPLDLTVVKESGMTIQNHPYSDIAGLYYSYRPKYTQFYNAVQSTVYDENMNVTSDSGKDVYLQAGYDYYLLHNGADSICIDLSEKTLHTFNSINEVLESQNTYNEIFRFTPIVTALYSFADGSYDVYDNGNLIAQNVSQCVLQKDIRYLIIKRQFGGYTKIYLDGNILSMGANNINTASSYSVFKLNIEERSRLAINGSNSIGFAIYDYALNEILLDHGYLFEIGEYYVIVGDSGEYDITIEEYVQQVIIKFYIDGEIYNDKTGMEYYYGKIATLPVPTKDRYNFNGWKYNGTLITDGNGVTNRELLSDEMTLIADWTLRGIIMEINVGNGVSKWWDGSKITAQNPGAVKYEGQFIELLVNMKRDFVRLNEGKKQGYFVDTFDYVKISSVGDVDYYEFTPVWKLEKYFIEFILPNSETYTIKRAVEYGESISSSVYPSQAFVFDKNQEFYSLIGWKLSSNSDIFKFAIGNAQFDLTPGYGSEFNLDTDGDGEFDSTIIRLNAAVEYVDYTIRINSTSYHVPQEGYTIGSLGSYGYTESNYYGHNVYLATPQKDRNFSFGSTIKVSDLTSYWTNGSRSVTVDMSFVDEEITIAISYNYSDCGNPSSYKGSDGNVILKPKYRRKYKFINWTLDGNVITILNYANLGIKQYYSNTQGVTLSKQIDANFTTMVSIKPTSGGKYTINDAATYVDLSRFSLMVNITFYITADAEEVTFVNGKCSDTQIVVYSRSTKLVLNFDNVNMKAKSNNSVIDAHSCSDLEIYSYNNVTLSAGEVNAEGSDAAILCKNLELTGENIYINGGNQVSGYGIYGNDVHLSKATAGIKCTEAGQTLSIKASYVKVQGGNGKAPVIDYISKEATKVGEKGEEGHYGCNGSDGAVAIYFIDGDVEVILLSTLVCVGGTGGNGGNGGTGGKGGPGNGVAIKKPGDGGDGGAGGDGGDGAKAIVCKSFTGNTSSLIDGKGGEGGKGGKGGEPGDPVTTIIGTKRGNKGIDGVDGKSGESGVSTLA